MKRILVLGAGLVGKAMALDLSKNFDVTAVDISAQALAGLEQQNVKTLQLDLSDADRLTQALAPFDLVVGAVPGFMGFKNAETVIRAGKNMVDISFFPEDPFHLDELAKKHNVTIVTDCGVAPGMGNVILGYHNKRMKIDSYECLVGGLPAAPKLSEFEALLSQLRYAAQDGGAEESITRRVS